MKRKSGKDLMTVDEILGTTLLGVFLFHENIVGIIVAAVPQALTIWGAEGIGMLKEVLARI